MARKPYSVLFLCTGNSARSIMAEAMLNHFGGGRFRAYSAGSHPSGKVNALSLETMRRFGVPVDGARSKSWDEFAAPGAPAIDFIITVCDNAAGETCPIWPGKPVTAHWGVDDPAAVAGCDDDRRAAFQKSARILRQRIQHLLALPLASLEARTMQRKLEEIGHQP
jgi:arsenate reductase (thioredoxin)